MSDHPITPTDFVGGVTVIDFGDMRVARGLPRRPHRCCEHRSVVYSTTERRIWCKNCEKDIEPFDAFELIIKQYDSATKQATRLLNEAREAQENTLISIASKKVDAAWRKRKMLPLSPCCGAVMFPENYKSGFSYVSKDLAYAKREKEKRAGGSPGPPS